MVDPRAGRFSQGFAAGGNLVQNKFQLEQEAQQQQFDQRSQLKERAKESAVDALKRLGEASKRMSAAYYTSKGNNDEAGMNEAIAIQTRAAKDLWATTKQVLESTGHSAAEVANVGQQFKMGAMLNNPAAEQKLIAAGEAEAKVQPAIDTAGGKQQFNDFVRMQNDKGQAIAVRKGDQPPAGFVPVSATASKQDITTTALTKPNVTIQQANETGATQSALEARELSDKITASDVGLRGIGNVFMAETIGQIFDSAVDEDVLNNRQAALALKEKTLKSMSDDKRFSNLDRQALEKLFVSMGAFESVKSAKTKLLGLADILEERASFSAGLLGHKPLHELRKDEIVSGMKEGIIDYVTGRRALVNYHGFGE